MIRSISIALTICLVYLTGCALPDPAPMHVFEVSGSVSSVNIAQKCLTLKNPGSGTQKEVFWDDSTRILREGKKVKASALISVKGEMVSTKVVAMGSRLVANTIAIPDVNRAPKIPGLENLHFIPARSHLE